MLAVSPLRNQKHENQGETMENYSIGSGDFPEFSDTSLLDSIDFDDLFVGINDGDVLPDLEIDPELLAEFSASGGEESEVFNTSQSSEKIEDSSEKIKDATKDWGSVSGSEDGSLGTKEEEIMSKRDESSPVTTHVSYTATTSSTKVEGEKGRKPSNQSHKNHNNNNPQGKRKVKVDWTPELHRRFVQAVEQLGVDKAVPSRILELMGIDCLTRHNIASHLQKYRSHRKHLLAREAEAASWNHKRQIYGAGAAAAPPGGGKRDMGGAWIAPATLGFPPVTPMHHFRPLHVWGHPTVDQSFVHMWPKHLPYSPSPPPPHAQPSWAPMQPHPSLTTAPEPSYWHSHHQRVPNALTPGTPCFPQPMAPTRFGAPPVPGIPQHHHTVYKVDPTGFGIPSTPPPPSAPGSHSPIIDFHPSKESIDAAVGDVLSKPWLPLPLGLKPPSVDGVMGELQRQGIPKIPPSCA